MGYFTIRTNGPFPRGVMQFVDIQKNKGTWQVFTCSDTASSSLSFTFPGHYPCARNVLGQERPLILRKWCWKSQERAWLWWRIPSWWWPFFIVKSSCYVFCPMGLSTKMYCPTERGFTPHLTPCCYFISVFFHWSIKIGNTSEQLLSDWIQILRKVNADF